MLFARFREIFLTLRFRLILWVTLIVFVLVTLSMVVIGQVVRRSLLFEFDALLRKDLFELRLFLREKPETPRLFSQLQHWVEENEQVGFVQLYYPSGELAWKSAGAPDLPPVEVGSGETIYRDFDKVRYAEGPDANSAWLLRVGLPRANLDDDLLLVNRTILLAGVCIVTLTPLAGFILARRATRPLQWILSTTARLQPEKLQERLPVRGSGDELDQLSKTINGMLDRIASYIQRNRDFVASAAHELRSPLAAIRASAEVALNRPRSNEEYAELLADVVEECSRLGTLVDRLLLLAEGDAGQISAAGHSSRLDKIVRESVDMFLGVAESQGITLAITALEPALVPGDEFHLRQVVRNLIDNAVKYATPPGEVELELTTDPQKRRALLRVKDQGCGIPREDLPHIFERFFRGDKSRQREPGKTGTGLGLSICHTIVQALEGEIRVESEPGKGTTFTVDFPLMG